jgi:hypothetical protein
MLTNAVCLQPNFFFPEASFYPSLNGIDSILDVENDNLADTIPDEAHFCHGRVYLFLFFCVEVLIIRYDKMVSHMMLTCAFIFVIKARGPGKDLPYHSIDMCTL